MRRRDLERLVVERLRVGGACDAEEIRRPGRGAEIHFAGLIVVVAIQVVPSICRGRRDDGVVHVGEIVRVVRQLVVVFPVRGLRHRFPAPRDVPGYCRTG